MSRPIILLLTASLLSSCTSMRLTQADEAYERMAYAKAAERYEQALGGINDPKKAATQRAAMLRAAEAYRRNHDMPHAGAWYERASAIGDLNMEQAYLYGQVLMAWNDRPGAAEQFLAVLTSNPEHRSAQDLLMSCENYPAFFEGTLRSCRRFPSAFRQTSWRAVRTS